MLAKRALIFIAVITIIFAVIVVSINKEINGARHPIGMDVEVFIPEGAGSRTVAEVLKKAGVIKQPLVYRIEAREFSGYKIGPHVVNTNDSYEVIMEKLGQVVDYEQNIKVVIPEGYEIRHIADELEAKGLINRAVFMAELEGEFDYPFIEYIERTENRLEGYLFPATYTIPIKLSEREIIEMMLDKFDSEFDESCYARAKELDMTPDEVITLASIIEREAQGDDDRGLVSSVFHNRLDSTNMPLLQSCATVQYVLKERKPVLLDADTRIDSLYNTYKYEGLPIGPIASPGKSSIDAALHPQESPYYFFVVGKDGAHVFSKTLEEHNAAQR